MPLKTIGSYGLYHLIGFGGVRFIQPAFTCFVDWNSHIAGEGELSVRQGKRRQVTSLTLGKLGWRIQVDATPEFVEVP